MAVMAAVTKAVVASCVVLVPGVAVGAVGVPVNVGDASNAPPAPVTSAEFNVTAPVRVLKETTPLELAIIALVTKAVVASCVVLVPADAVGAAGTPVNVGEASNAPPAPVTSAEFKVTAPVRVLKEVTASASVSKSTASGQRLPKL